MLASMVVGATPTPQAGLTPETRAAARQIIGDSVLNGQAYEYDRQLADEIGPRLTGSRNYLEAVGWAERTFKSLGLANVHAEEWTIPATWEPEVPAAGRILAPVVHTLSIVSLGWSPSTPPGGISGDVVYVKELTPEKVDEQAGQLAGAIALIDKASVGEKPDLPLLLQALEHLRSTHPKAIVNTGVANGADNMSALGFGGRIAPLPQVQVGLEDSLLIKRLLDRGPVTLEFTATNRIAGDVKISNVVADLPGRDPAAGMVLVGAHLDSWHPGTGAQDNGTGVAGVLETARVLKGLKSPPRRTIRFVLFGGEEQGLLGSTAYARQHADEAGRIDAVLVTDSGAEPAKGWVTMGREDEKDAVSALKPLLAGLGADGFSAEADFAFQTDHAAFEFQGVPELVLWTGSDKYMALHHKASDTFDSVVNKDVTQGAAVIAVTAYAIAEGAQAFAPHLTPAELRAMAEKAKILEGWEYLKSKGVLP
jgi:hypothetical protein